MIVADTENNHVLIFGAGLIGLAVIDAICLRSDSRLTTAPLDWRSPALRADQLASIERHAIDAASERKRLTIVWSAGRAGFMARAEDTAVEFETYREVLRMAASLARRHHVAFHLVSSAGGLFEGQRHVTRDTIPAPRRPYGHLKLQQERALLDEGAFTSRTIYRVSTAYGPLHENVRAGFIATLLRNAARREVTHITGRMETLRDFVFTGDVGAHIAASIIEAQDHDAVVVLASGRPYSLAEVLAIIERAVGRKALVTYSHDAANAEDITFDAGVLPKGWAASDLRFNVAHIFRDAISRGLIDVPHPAARAFAAPA
jgi:nucleoside-diphosphate-sugar epimerase